MMQQVQNRGEKRRLMIAAWVAVLALLATETPTAVRMAWAGEYAELVAKAKKEGEVVVYAGSGRERRRARTEPFQKKYGIKVSFVSGRSTEIAGKTRAEYAARVYLGDVWFGSGTRSADLAKEGILAPLEPLLFLPEVTDTSLFLGGKHWWRGVKKGISMINAAYQTNIISYNVKRIKGEEIESAWDLLKPKFKGRIALVEPDPGSGANQVLTWIYQSPQMGPEWIRRLLAEMKPGLFSDGRMATDRLAQGVYDIGMFFYSAARRGAAIGLPIANRTKPFKEGAMLSSGGSNDVAILARPPHPNAQKLYVNWWLSREGQSSFQKLDRDYQSIRNDIPVDAVPVERRRQPGVNYFFPAANTNTPIWAGKVNKLWWNTRQKR